MELQAEKATHGKTHNPWASGLTMLGATLGLGQIGSIIPQGIEAYQAMPIAKMGMEQKVAELAAQLEGQRQTREFLGPMLQQQMTLGAMQQGMEGAGILSQMGPAMGEPQQAQAFDPSSMMATAASPTPFSLTDSLGLNAGI
jgi:hypothetical protein